MTPLGRLDREQKHIPVAPVAGNVLAGSCYLVVDVPTLWTVEPPRRKRRGLFGR